MDRNLDSLKQQQTIEFYEFSGFRLDVSERRLWHGEEHVSLTPKEFEVLFYLVECAGKVVEKNELLDAIWAETYVEETTLARNVSWLRKKLKKYSKGEKLIETVPKRGYRFVAEVTASSKDENIIFIEEQTVENFQLEETITISDKIPLSGNHLDLPNPKPRNEKLRLMMFAASLLIFAGLIFVGNQIYLQYSQGKIIQRGERFKLMLRIAKEDRLYLSGGRSDRRGDPDSPSSSVVTKRQLNGYERTSAFKSYQWLINTSGPIKYGEKYFIRLEEQDLSLSGGREEFDIFDDEVVPKEDIAGRKARLDARRIIVRNNRQEPEDGMTWVYTNPRKTLFEESRMRNTYYWQICRSIEDCGSGAVRFGDKVFLRMNDLSGDLLYLVGGKGLDQSAVFTNPIRSGFDSEKATKYYQWEFLEIE